MKAIALLSGGLDSTVAYYFACKIKGDEEVIPLFFDYGQRALSKELECALSLAKARKAELYQVKMPLPNWIGSTITVPSLKMPAYKNLPASFVPGRNIIMLSYAGALAKVSGAEEIYGGWNVMDYSGYPDCDDDFLQNMHWALRRGLDHETLRIQRPLVDMKKSDIILMGTKVGVPFEQTWSCYLNVQKPCKECDSCKQRAKAFTEAGIEDPLMEVTK